MIAKFFRPDGSEIANGGTTNLNYGPHDVENVLNQVYGEIWKQHRIKERNLPVPYYITSSDVVIEDCGDEKYPVLKQDNYSISVELRSCQCIPAFTDIQECSKLRLYWKDKIPPPCAECAKDFEGMQFGEQVAIKAVERIKNYGH